MKPLPAPTLYHWNTESDLCLGAGMPSAPQAQTHQQCTLGSASAAATAQQQITSTCATHIPGLAAARLKWLQKKEEGRRPNTGCGYTAPGSTGATLSGEWERRVTQTSTQTTWWHGEIHSQYNAEHCNYIRMTGKEAEGNILFSSKHMSEKKEEETKQRVEGRSSEGGCLKGKGLWQIHQKDGELLQSNLEQMTDTGRALSAAHSWRDGASTRR